MEVDIGRDGWYGWVGHGGSVMQWHPELKIGFGYVPTNLRWYDGAYEVGRDLQKIAVECARMALNKTTRE